MTLYPPRSLRPLGVTAGVQWLILVLFLFGANISSIGAISSHGLAAIGPAFHVTSFSSGESYDHVHEDEDNAAVSQSAGADHAHHGGDHSHDKAHAVSAAWSTAAAQAPGWLGRVRPWSEMIQPSRLERPPKG